MFALDNKKWRLLNHAYGKADDIPEMLLELEENFESEKADKLFYGYLCHQYSTYSATFAAVPHIKEIAFRGNSSSKIQADIIIFCGLVHASRNGDNRSRIASDDKQLIAKLTEQIQAEYLKSIKKLVPLTEKLLNENRLNDEDKRLLFFSFLAFHGQEKLSRMFFTFCELDEFILNCLNCKNEIYLCAEESKMVAYKEDAVFIKSAEKFELLPIEICWKDWNGEFSNEQKAKWVLYLAEKYNIEPLKYQIPYLFNEMVCPHCSQSINILDSLVNF